MRNKNFMLDTSLEGIEIPLADFAAYLLEGNYESARQIIAQVDSEHRDYAISLLSAEMDGSFLVLDFIYWLVARNESASLHCAASTYLLVSIPWFQNAPQIAYYHALCARKLQPDNERYNWDILELFCHPDVRVPLWSASKSARQLIQINSDNANQVRDYIPDYNSPLSRNLGFSQHDPSGAEHRSLCDLLFAADYANAIAMVKDFSRANFMQEFHRENANNLNLSWFSFLSALKGAMIFPDYVLNSLLVETIKNFPVELHGKNSVISRLLRE